MAVFWSGTAMCVLCALCFVVPPLLTTRDKTTDKYSTSFWVSSCIVIALPIMAYYIYSVLGQSKALTQFYSEEAIAQRRKSNNTRDLYTKLQREVIKSKLNIAIDLQNLDLILSFAKTQADLTNGVLPNEVHDLLNAVLQVQPNQITTLNLLAIHAYKTKNYSQAKQYWQNILQQLEFKQSDLATRELLQAKITQIELFESKQTKMN